MTRKKRKRTWGFLLLFLVAVGSAGAWAWKSGALGGERDAAIAGQAVRLGSLRISVVERGNLKAAHAVVLSSELEGRSTILSIIEEGTIVQPGDLLCELDVTGLVEERVAQDISVQNSEAAFVKAKQNFEIQKSENESDIARAERELEFSKLDLNKYVEGDWPQEKQQQEEEILLANEELTRAKQDLEWSEKLAAKGFLEATQLEADRLAHTRAEIRLKQEKRALELLEAYSYPRQLAELEADVVEKGRELKRVELQAAARIVDYEADLRTSKAKFDLEAEEFAKIESQIEKAQILAPVAGMVVYAQQDGGRWGRDSEPIQEGTEVRERQEIITIPATNAMIVEASLHESVLEKVTEGMPCWVTIDALPGKSFHGTVKYKSVLPDQNSWWANPDLRVYRTMIEVNDIDTRMRPGMSCSIEIVVDDIHDALHMPVQSVFLDGGDPVCFVDDEGQVEKRSLEVGLDNGKWVQVLKGVTEGEIVLLSLPEGAELKPMPDNRPGFPFEIQDEFPGGLKPEMKPGDEGGEQGLEGMKERGGSGAGGRGPGRGKESAGVSDKPGAAATPEAGSLAREPSDTARTEAAPTPAGAPRDTQGQQ